MLPEPFQQLRLTHEANLQKRLLSALEVREQTELLESRVRQEMRLVDDQNRYLRGARQEPFDPPQELRLGARPVAIEPEAAQNLFEELASAEACVAEDGHGNLRRKGIHHRSYRRRLSGADLPHHEEEAFPIQPRVMKMLQSLDQLLATERTRWVGKGSERAFDETKVARVHRIPPAFSALPFQIGLVQETNQAGRMVLLR
jgi:hypothetical protein